MAFQGAGSARYPSGGTVIVHALAANCKSLTMDGKTNKLP